MRPMVNKNADRHPKLVSGSSRNHPGPPELDLVSFSHLRWDFVYQRPQHLLSRAAQSRRVWFVEEPHYDAARPSLETRRDPSGVTSRFHTFRVTLRAAPARHGSTSFSRPTASPLRAWYTRPLALDYRTFADRGDRVRLHGRAESVCRKRSPVSREERISAGADMS